MTTQTLLKNGYAVKGLASKPISAEVWESADIVINMSGRAKEFAFRNLPGHAKVEDWEIVHPYGAPDQYQETYEKIQRRVAELAQRLRRQSGIPEGMKNTPPPPPPRDPPSPSSTFFYNTQHPFPEHDTAT